jgi:hypothetical protein
MICNPTHAQTPRFHQRFTPPKAQAPVADQIHHHIMFESLSPVSRQLTHPHHTLNVVRIHVEDGAVEGLGHVSAVGAAAGFLGVRGEGNLREQVWGT